MKTSLTLSLLLLPGLLMAQMNYWGSGQMMGGQQGCGYQQQMGMQAQSESDEVVDLKQQIKDLEQQRKEKSKELQQSKIELRKSEMGMKMTFDTDVFSFLKSHMDSRIRCQDYIGFGDNKNKKPDEESSITEIEPKELANAWASVCDMENNPRGKIKTDICAKKNLLSRPDLATCKDSVVKYPRAKSNVDRLVKELEGLKQSITETKAALAEARKQKVDPSDIVDPADRTEGGICYECLAGGGGSSRGGQRGNQNVDGNLTGVVTNSLMALMAYSSTKNFYGEMADKNADLGFPTPMPASSPFMAAAPYLLGAINVGMGQGSFGCSGQSGGGMSGMMGGGLSAMMGGQSMMSGGMNSSMMGGGLNAMMMGGLGGQMSGQIGGAFGMPQWAQSSPLNALSMMGGLNMNSGMNMGGLSMMGGTSPYSLTGLSGLNGLNGLSGLGGNNTQILQYQLQQQQLSMQQQMQYYQNAIQKTQAMSGLQTELSGLIQRIQQVQSGSSYYGSNYNYGINGGLGGLPSYGTSTLGTSR
tara:strand:- start:49707 stop:51290 length:1584 start_codon:yes stop_codon:yes gene_type:complete